MKSIIVTGCYGFLGSHFTKLCLDNGFHVYGIDSLTYAADTMRLHEFFIDEMDNRFTSIQEDISKIEYLPDADYLINFAAETHVDNSIYNHNDFVKTNVQGVKHLLDLCLPKKQYKPPLFVQISTDEVYGDNLTNNPFTEEQILNPSNPYSASKAAADLLVLSYARTYDLDYLIFRPTNNYGTGQHPEKFIPKCIQLLMRDEKIQIHGDGSFQRCWLNVHDTCDAIFEVLDSNLKNEIYNISGDEFASVKSVARLIVSKFHKNYDLQAQELYMEFGFQRKGADVNYKIDDTKLRTALDWEPKIKLLESIDGIIKYTKGNFRW